MTVKELLWDAWGIAKDIATGGFSLLNGHHVTMTNFWRPRVTEWYPREKRVPPPGFRGGFAQLWDAERDRPNCIACQLCARACPDNCIYIEGDDAKGKNKRPVVFDLDMAVCMFCGLCVEACPHNALTMTSEYEFSTADKGSLIVTLEQMIETGKRLGLTEVQRPPQVPAEAQATEEQA